MCLKLGFLIDGVFSKMPMQYLSIYLLCIIQTHYLCDGQVVVRSFPFDVVTRSGHRVGRLSPVPSQSGNNNFVTVSSF